MKLRFAATSPYVRKVVILLHETGQFADVELIPTNVWDASTDVAADNPLGKVPALILGNGRVLFDSPVICEYLDAQHDGETLFPAPGPERWAALRLQALADGGLDALLLRRMEGLREPPQQSETWIARQIAAVDRSFDVLEREAASLEGTPTIGTITVGCLLGYRDFRFDADGWRDGRPRLAAWYQTFSQRPSMLATIPIDPG
jgi:glutathione S-transferase